MTRYANLAGNSPITAYEITGDSITVEFDSAHTYMYTYASTGKKNIEQMKNLAIAGRGLSTFISRVVKERYAKKIR